MMYYFCQPEIERMGDYNRVIARVAQRYGAKLIDLWTNAAEYSSVDLAHPDRNGMEIIARAVIEAISR